MKQTTNGMMRAFWLSIFLLFSGWAYSQDYITAQSLSGKDAKRYDKAREAARAGDYDAAERDLTKLIEDHPRFFDAYALQADIAYDRRDFAQAVRLYQQALALSQTEEPVLLYRAGLASFRQKEFLLAADFFEDFLASGYQKERLRKRAQKYLVDAKFSAEAYSHPVEFLPESISDLVNSPAKEYLPAFNAEGNFLIFTANVDGTATRNGQEDFYYTTKDSLGQWMKPQALTSINTDKDEGAITITPDGRMMVFTSCYRPDGAGRCDLYVSYLKNDTWTRPQNMGKAINTYSNERNSSLSADGRRLYFSSDRNGGLGGYDLWVSTRDRKDVWSKPINLGPTINTEGNEEAPFLHADDQTLYFMSDGHPSIGGYDLYLSRLEDGQWSTPKNLGYPINTTADEGALSVSLDGKMAYYTTDENTPEGAKLKNFDIYQFPLYAEARPQPVTYLKATVVDAANNKKLSGVRVFISDPDNTQYQIEKSTAEDGSFLMVLPAGRNYSLRVSETGYLFYSDFFELRDSNSFSRPYELNIALQTAPTDERTVSEPIVLRNIFFATASAELKQQSQAELDLLRTLLKENPQWRIRINGHTDNVGEPDDNVQLSEARAESVRQYLIAQGVDKERIEVKGFGEGQPIADNDTAEGRARNRRTEFQIIGEKDKP